MHDLDMRNVIGMRARRGQRWLRAALVAPLAGLALLLAACGQHAYMPPRTGYAPTFTPAPPGLVAWQIRPAPAPLDVQPPYPYQPPTLALAQSDGNIVYECAASAEARGAAVWVTRDRAAHWQRMADVVTGGEVDMCRLVVDDLDPARAVAVTYKDARDKCMACFDGTWLSFVTDDYGATWRPLHGPFDDLRQLATLHGVTYALFQPHLVDLVPLQTRLVKSSDGMRTWTAIDGDPTSASGRYVTRFWLNPATGEMLALTSTSWVDTGQFWATGDGGTSWTQMRTPPADDFLVQTPSTAQPWHICGLYTAESNTRPTPPAVLTCTSDGGRTWTNRGGPSGLSGSGIFALADDGSVLETRVAFLGTPSPYQQSKLFRLIPASNGDDWQSLGLIPQPAGMPTYVPGSGTGVIWAIPQAGGEHTTTPAPLYVASYA